MSNTKHLYRSLLREVRLATKKPSSERGMIVKSHFRDIVASASASTDMDRLLTETRDFLRSSRIHAELLKRYNPIADMSEEEKIHATARRVGMDVPLEYKPDRS